ASASASASHARTRRGAGSPGASRRFGAGALLYWLRMTPAAAPARAATSEALDALREAERAVGSVIRGKPEAIRLAVPRLRARGQLTSEGIPGAGKTSRARALAAALGGSFRRIQSTSDRLPSGIVGVSIYRADRHEFELRRGPIFANVVLADEINRPTP